MQRKGVSFLKADGSVAVRMRRSELFMETESAPNIYIKMTGHKQS